VADLAPGLPKPERDSYFRERRRLGWASLGLILAGIILPFSLVIFSRFLLNGAPGLINAFVLALFPAGILLALIAMGLDVASRQAGRERRVSLGLALVMALLALGDAKASQAFGQPSMRFAIAALGASTIPVFTFRHWWSRLAWVLPIASLGWMSFVGVAYPNPGFMGEQDVFRIAVAFGQLGLATAGIIRGALGRPGQEAGPSNNGIEQAAGS
jgi:hypothetical protein